MRFTITTTDLNTFVSVVWYINKLKNNNTNCLFLSECNHYDRNDNKIIDFVCYDEKFNFTYKDIEISFERKRYGEPKFIHSRCEMGYFEEIILIPNIDESDEGLEIMKDFFIESTKKYKDNKKAKSTDEKLILWSYSDGFWENVKRVNSRDINTVILNEDIKEDVKKSIEQYSNEDFKNKLKSFGIGNKMNLILSGLPGTGKSSLMFAIATLLKKDIATIDFNSRDLSDHKFIKALNRIPDDCIFALEDVDALYVNRDKSRDNTVSFSCILNFLDGVYSKDDLVTIITTNHLEVLDKAIIRPMRIDKIIHFTYCSKYQYTKIFEKFFPDKDDLIKDIYKIIKNKKFTTSMLQNWLIKFIYEPDKLLDNIKLFDEIIDVSSEKDCNMFT